MRNARGKAAAIAAACLAAALSASMSCGCTARDAGDNGVEVAAALSAEDVEGIEGIEGLGESGLMPGLLSEIGSAAKDDANLRVVSSETSAEGGCAYIRGDAAYYFASWSSESGDVRCVELTWHVAGVNDDAETEQDRQQQANLEASKQEQADERAEAERLEQEAKAMNTAIPLADAAALEAHGVPAACARTLSEDVSAWCSKKGYDPAPTVTAANIEANGESAVLKVTALKVFDGGETETQLTVTCSDGKNKVSS